MSGAMPMRMSAPIHGNLPGANQANFPKPCTQNTQPACRPMPSQSERVRCIAQPSTQPTAKSVVNDAHAVVVVLVAPDPEHHGAEAVAADLDPGTAKRGSFHLWDPTPMEPKAARPQNLPRS